MHAVSRRTQPSIPANIKRILYCSFHLTRDCFSNRHSPPLTYLSCSRHIHSFSASLQYPTLNPIQSQHQITHRQLLQMNIEFVCTNNNKPPSLLRNSINLSSEYSIPPHPLKLTHPSSTPLPWHILLTRPLCSFGLWTSFWENNTRQTPNYKLASTKNFIIFRTYTVITISNSFQQLTCLWL